MIRNTCPYIILIWLMLLPLSLLQAQDSTDVVNSASTDSLQINTVATADSLSQGEDESAEKIRPWIQHQLPASRLITADSLLRWQIWPDWGTFQAYRSNAFSFRQGTIGRTDAYYIAGYFPGEQEVELEGIRLNDPVSGLVNYSMVPQRKIRSVREQYRSGLYQQIRLRDYYITEPISYLNYDESKFDYRNLEFMVTRNFTERTNLELSYLDRRDGDFYPSNKVEGSQIMGRLYHYLKPHLQLRVLYLRNQLKRDEPFGYNIGDPNTFAFGRYTSQPNSSGASSDNLRWDLKTGIYLRDQENGREKAGAEFTLNRLKNTLRTSADTLITDLTGFNTRAFSLHRFGPVDIRNEATLSLYNAGDRMPITELSWTKIQAGSELKVALNKYFGLFAAGEVSRLAGRSGYEFGGGIESDSAGIFSIHAGAYLFDKAPEIQQRYWSGGGFSGSDVRNEKGLSVYSRADVQLGDFMHFGLEGRFRDVSDPVHLSMSDSVFSNGSDLEQLSATVHADYLGQRFEFRNALLFQQVNQQGSAGPGYAEEMIWLKNAAYVKGYVFDRAAFVKAGVRTLFSPVSYDSRTYRTRLNYWTANSAYEPIPAFFRLDAELSARVRSIMVVMRMENALDGLGQSGYFEAAGYPMPPRRLIIGIRARFIN